MLKIDCSTDRIQIARIALILPSSIVPGGAGEYIAGALTHAPDRFLLASDSYNYLGYKTAERKTISRTHFSFLRFLIPFSLPAPVPTLGSFDVKAVGSLTKWAGNLSTTSLFSWSMMLTIFLSRRISIF